MTTLHTPLNLCLPAQLTKKLAAAQIRTVGDLLYCAPRRYYHWGNLTAMHSLQYGQDVTLLARVTSASLIGNRQRGGVRLEVALTDGRDTMRATFFGKNQYSLIPHQKLLTPGSTHLFAGKVGQYRGQLQLAHPQFEEITETDEESARARQQRPIPIYPLSKGLTPWVMQRAIDVVLTSINDDDIPEYVPETVRTQHGLLSHAQALRALHQPQNDEDFQLAQRSLRFHEAFTLQVVLRQKRIGAQAQHSYPCAPQPNGLEVALLTSLPFTLTNQQSHALEHIMADMSIESPMMRLLQGDVGSGKTVIAALASARAIDNNYQVAMLVPTEVLAEQHVTSLRELFGENYAHRVALLSASTRPHVRRELSERLQEGEPLLVVGTHALLEEGIPFTSLALVIVDEQHRFGVVQRDHLRDTFTVRDEHALVPHQLVMTATPIPRTVAMTVFGDLDETRMYGLPPGRTPVKTYCVDSANIAWMNRVWERAQEEINRGGRVYVVCPRIDAADTAEATDGSTQPNSTSSHDTDRNRFLLLDEDNLAQHSDSTDAAHEEPRTDLASVEKVSAFLRAHPQLGGYGIAELTSRNTSAEKNAIMAAFAQGSTPILVATTVIEVGVNVPEATMMVIMDAQQFGLSQLHQLRGRVGRANIPSLCMAIHRHDISADSFARLQAFAQTTDGFELALADVKLRKEGDVLGAGQSGRATSLRFLSVVRDAEIIEQAREAATCLVEEDPSLASYPGLASHVAELQRLQAQWMEKA